VKSGFELRAAQKSRRLLWKRTQLPLQIDSCSLLAYSLNL